MTKKCTYCKRFLPLDAFGTEKRTITGLAYGCRSCRRAKDRARYHKNKGNKEFMDRMKESVKKSIAKYPEKNRARQAAYRARMRNPELRKKNCEHCGTEGKPWLEMHHFDYDKPEEVITLCKRCHAQVHHGAAV